MREEPIVPNATAGRAGRKNLSDCKFRLPALSLQARSTLPSTTHLVVLVSRFVSVQGAVEEA